MLRQIAPLSYALVVICALGASTGCAAIHPAPNDPDDGMLEAPTDEADQFRRAEERAAEDRDDREEGGGRRR